MKKKLLIVLFFMLPYPMEAEPRIKHFFPSHTVRLGHPVYWTVEIRSPVWESYDIRLNPCKGAQLRIADATSIVQNDEITKKFRIEILPTDLFIPETPSVLLSDEKGQSMVINGRKLNLTPISGSSLEIKDPGKLSSIKRQSWNRFLYAILLFFFGLLIVLIWKRYYSTRPRQILLRDLKKAAVEIRNQRLPVQVWRLLRSELLWGFPAEVLTPSQLKQQARWDIRLTFVAEGLQALETWRYAGNGSIWEKDPVEKSLRAAIEILGGKK